MHALLFAGPSASLLFLPDHDDWAGTLGAVGAADLRQWFESLQADIILLDGTFWSLDELQHRDQMEVPHPPVRETVELLGPRQKGDPELFFVHLNHTNPLLIETSAEVGEVRLQGWDIAHEGQRWDL
jgi:pyrroloquinoline quinone biosynthesis protein B